MHLTGREVVIESKPGFNTKQSPFHGQTGEIQAYRFDVSSGRVAFLVRFGDTFSVFYHDEVKLAPDDVREMDADAELRRRYYAEHPGT